MIFQSVLRNCLPRKSCKILSNFVAFSALMASDLFFSRPLHTRESLRNNLNQLFLAQLLYCHDGGHSKHSGFVSRNL